MNKKGTYITGYWYDEKDGKEGGSSKYLARFLSDAVIYSKVLNPEYKPDYNSKLNPNIKYFDSVFDIIEENPELYKSIKNEHLRGNPIQFNFFPSKQEIAERQKYFEEKRQKYPTRTIDRFYQDELVETLNKRFNQCLEKIANI